MNEGVRIDGRGVTDIRPLSAEVGIINTVHGSGLFQRGETQVLSVPTLGMPRMEQIVDTLGLDDRKRYMHHYNFPPFSTGETGRVGSPKRREIGHGALAERALLPVVPSKEEWPYTLRVVSDVLSSNGSTSMASVCGSTLSMMDAGVPIKAPVAGIAMGLVFARRQVHDPHRHPRCGGRVRRHGLQGRRDVRVRDRAAARHEDRRSARPTSSLKALQQAKVARLEILDVMHDAIAEPRADVRPTAPKIVSFEIPIDKIGEVIGPKGKVINTIQQETGADIAVSDDGMVGTVSIGSKEGEKVEEARRRIELILDPPTAELGAEYTGRVVNITKFGAFVNILPGRDGLLHISKLGRGKRIDRVEDVLDLGDEVTVRVDDIDNSGKLSLSLVGEEGDDAGSGGGGDRPERSSRAGRGSDGDRGDRGGNTGPPKDVASFDAAWDEEAKKEFGDLGPAEAPSRGGGDRDRGPRARRRADTRRCSEHQLALGRLDTAEAVSGAERSGNSGIETTRLPSGLRVLTESMPELRSVAIGFWVGTGAIDEPDHLLGASHFLEHLLFKGTATRSASEIAGAIESVGGDMNAFTTQEYTAFYVRVPDDHLEVAADILSAVVWAPAFRPDEVDSERQVILEEIRMRDDTPDDIVHELFAAALYPKHPLGRSVLGSRGTIVAAERDAIAAYHAEHYRPANVVVAAAGNLAHERMVELIGAGARASTTGRGRTGSSRRSRRRTRSSPSGAGPSRPTWCSACARSPATTRTATRCRS